MTIENALRELGRLGIPGARVEKDGDGWVVELLATATLPAVELRDTELPRLCGRAAAAHRKREARAKLTRKLERAAAAREASKPTPVARRILRAFRSRTRSWGRSTKRKAWARAKLCTTAVEVDEVLEAFVAGREQRVLAKRLERRAASDALQAAGYVRGPHGGQIAVRAGANLSANAKGLLTRLGLGHVVERAERAERPRLDGVSPSDVEIVEG